MRPIGVRLEGGGPGLTTYFVSRHVGAVDWLRQKGLSVDKVVAHLDPESAADGDLVLGTLPVNLAADVCERGCRYMHLSLEVPAERRGTELTAADMDLFGARLEEYVVSRAEKERPGVVVFPQEG